jgi:prepilin-type N-terminal cleavage/methylation domain-containing protein/prepilin-type processing-associated H-X9-DG protein
LQLHELQPWPVKTQNACRVSHNYEVQLQRIVILPAMAGAEDRRTMMSHQVVGQMGHGARRDARGDRRSRGFTLMEMLIVIGIVALLLALVVTGITKARSMANRTECISNLKTIGAAIHQYLIDNNDTFPLAASYKGHKDGDFLYWQSTTLPTGSQFVVDLIGSGGIGKYISGLDDASPSGLRALRCPVDERLDAQQFLSTVHPPYPAGYPFSYVISAFMVSGNYPDYGPDLTTVVRTMSRVKDASSKIMAYEEDSRTINDGVGSLEAVDTSTANGTPLLTTNLLSCRHDIREPLTTQSMTNPPDPDAPIAVTIARNGPPQILQMNHMSATGNVLFADGHAGSVDRAFAHVKAHYAPDPDAPALKTFP